MRKWVPTNVYRVWSFFFNDCGSSEFESCVSFEPLHSEIMYASADQQHPSHEGYGLEVLVVHPMTMGIAQQSFRPCVWVTFLATVGLHTACGVYWCALRVYASILNLHSPSTSMLPCSSEMPVQQLRQFCNASCNPGPLALPSKVKNSACSLHLSSQLHRKQTLFRVIIRWLSTPS